MFCSGKCSHGGKRDKTSTTEPIGGINKDEISSDHGMYHNRAADLAIGATMELLEDIRLAKGNSAFLRYGSIFLRHSIGFCFQCMLSAFSNGRENF